MDQLWLLSGPDCRLDEYLAEHSTVEGRQIVNLDQLPAVVNAVAALVAQYGDLVAGGAFSHVANDRQSYYDNIYTPKVAALEPVVAALIADPSYDGCLLASVMCWDVPPESLLIESRCMLALIDLVENASWVNDFVKSHAPQEVQ